MGSSSTLVLADPQGLLTRAADGIYTGKTITLDAQTVAAGKGTLRLDVTLPEGYKFNETAPFLGAYSASGGAEINGGSVTVQQLLPSFPQQIPVLFTAGTGELQADLVIYCCEAEAESLCLLEQVRLLLPIEVAESGTAVAEITHPIPLPPVTNN